jgi:hypothetical protein
MIYCGIPTPRVRESIIHSGNGHHGDAATTEANTAWAKYVSELVHQSIMDALHAVSGEFAKLIEDVNGDFNKNIDVFDVKIKAAIANCERAAAEMRSDIPALIDEAVAKHVAQAIANFRQPSDGAPGPAGPPGKLEIVKDHVENRVYHERDLVVAGDGALYQVDCDTAATPPHADWRCITRAGRDGHDALNFSIEGTHDPAKKYRRLSIVTLNGSSFVARHDDPGPCPGDGWQLLASASRRGQQGLKGERGERGSTGPLAIAPRMPAAKSMPDTISISFTPTALRTAFRCVRHSSNSLRRQAHDGRNPGLSSRRLQARQGAILSRRILGGLLPARR